MQLILNTETAHDTNMQVYDGEAEWVELVCYDRNVDDEPRYYSLTAEEARRLADAILTASQRVADRLPHFNS